MNINAISPAFSRSATTDGAGVMVMKKALDAFSQDGQNIVALLRQSAPPVSPPNLGNNVDIKA